MRKRHDLSVYGLRDNVMLSVQVRDESQPTGQIDFSVEVNDGFNDGDQPEIVVFCDLATYDVRVVDRYGNSHELQVTS